MMSVDGKRFKELINLSNRQKRSLDVVGTLMKWAIGVADADDVKKYDNFIDHFVNNEKDIYEITHNQVSIVKTLVNNFNESISTLNEVYDGIGPVPVLQ